MYGIALVFFFLVSLVGVSMGVTMQMAEDRHEANVMGLAENVGVYMSFSKAYAKSHSGYSGAVSDASLGLPSWYGKTENMRLIVQSGVSYIYLQDANLAVFADAGNYINDRIQLGGFGVKQGSTMLGADGSTYTLPSSIPDGSYVLVVP